jgi:hypothetical protein
MRDMPLGEPKTQKRVRADSKIINVSGIEDMPLGEPEVQNQCQSTKNAPPSPVYKKLKSS